MKFKRKGAVTLPLLKQQANETIFVTLTSPIFTGKKVDEQKEPAQLVHVIDLSTGQEMEYIVPTVLEGTLKEKYLDNEYVGMSFEITKFPKKSGKNYHTFEIFEIDPNDTVEESEDSNEA